MLFQPFDTEEFLADGDFGIPRRYGRTSFEDAQDRRDQVNLSAARARELAVKLYALKRGKRLAAANFVD